MTTLTMIHDDRHRRAMKSDQHDDDINAAIASATMTMTLSITTTDVDEEQADDDHAVVALERVARRVIMCVVSVMDGTLRISPT